MTTRPCGVSDPDGLARLLSTLLPGDARYPAAADLDLAATVSTSAARQDADRVALEGAVSLLASSSAPEDAFRRFVGQRPADARRVLELVYTSYYAHPEVLRVLEARSGYPARPPQPLGYEPASGAAELAACAERRAGVLREDEWWDPAFGEEVEDAVAHTW